MWWIGRMAGLGVLLVLSYIDIRIHRVPVKLLAVSNIAAILYYIIFREINIWALAGGAGVGIIFLIISRVTREGFGYADSWGILILGLYLGFWKLLELLFAAFSMLAIFAIAMLAGKKMSRRCVLPFFPFLTVGYVAVLLGTGGVL